MNDINLNIRINESIELMELSMQKYAKDFLVDPKEIEVYENIDQEKKIKVFLVHNDPDNPYKVYYDVTEDRFGLICVLENNNWWAMGLYGEFNNTLSSM